MVENIIGVELEELEQVISPGPASVLLIRDPATSKDYKILKSDLLGGNGTGLPDWDADTIFNITDNKYCIYNLKIWKSKIAGNQNHAPAENTYWTEISKSDASSIAEYAPGLYTAADVVVKHFGYLYELIDDARPFESIDLATELAEGKWRVLNLSIPFNLEIPKDDEIDSKPIRNNVRKSSGTPDNTFGLYSSDWLDNAINSLKEVFKEVTRWVSSADGDEISTREFYILQGGVFKKFMSIQGGSGAMTNGFLSLFGKNGDAEIFMKNDLFGDTLVIDGREGIELYGINVVRLLSDNGYFQFQDKNGYPFEFYSNNVDGNYLRIIGDGQFGRLRFNKITNKWEFSNTDGTVWTELGSTAVADAFVYKGAIDCSGNPNYPAADAGETYKISVAGKIGGAGGENVEAGDMIICTNDGTIAGNQATVGVYWDIIQKNIDGAVIGPAAATDGNFPLFDGATGKLLKESGISPATISNAIALKEKHKGIKGRTLALINGFAKF